MKFRINFIPLAAALFAFSAVPAFSAADMDGVLVRLRPDDSAAVAEGLRVYAENCAACHGDTLQGQDKWRDRNEQGRLPAPPHDDTGHTWHHADDLLFEITKFGINKMLNDASYETDMPAYEEILSDAEIISVLSYIKSTWSPKTKDWHDRVNAAFNADWQPVGTNN